MGTIREVIETYHAAWNEPDTDDRGRLLEHCWADYGTLVTREMGAVSGREALSGAIGALHQHWPGDRAITSGIDEHHGLLRYSWQVVDADGSQVLDGVAFGELASDGRLQRIVEFNDPIPGTD
jgi:hypothetical protein